MHLQKTWILALAGVCTVACSSDDSSNSAAPEFDPASAPVVLATCAEARDCDDGVVCNGEERCEEGVCLRGEAPDCDDGIACTVDACLEDAGGCLSRAPDEDGDGHGDASCEDDNGDPLGDDCDDNDAGRYPGNTEVCDEDDHDEDCDVTTYGAVDLDSDGHDDDQCCNVDDDGTPYCGDDCADADRPNTHAGAPELCDERDNDCDEVVDEGALSTWYLDYDGDSYGDDDRAVEACDAPTSDYIDVPGDCDDGDPAFNPGASLGCDGMDYNCDGDIDNDGDGDTYSDITCGGSDCDDSDPAVLPEVGGGCALGTTCLEILDLGRSVGDGVYTIDPDGYGAGLDPFDVTCDMSSAGGGWTAIPYAEDLDFIQHFTGGDGYRYFDDDFELALADEQVAAIQDLSTEGWQQYVGYCEHVIHYYYADSDNHDYAFGFRFFDGTETPAGSSSYSPYDITVIADGCAGNGGEGGDPDEATVFEFYSPLVPVINVNTNDVGDTFPEYFGSPLLDNPAWLR